MAQIPTSNYRVYTFIISTGCIREVESAQERPPAKADFSTLPTGITTSGATATTVAASN